MMRGGRCCLLPVVTALALLLFEQLVEREPRLQSLRRWLAGVFIPRAAAGRSEAFLPRFRPGGL